MSRDRNAWPTRRDLVSLGIGAFVVAALPFGARRRRQVMRRTLPVMGTLAEIAVAHSRPDRAGIAIDAAMSELALVERTMSRFRPASDVGQANALAATRPVTVTAASAEVIRAALDWARISDGAFDPAIGRVVELWDVTHRHAPPPVAEWQRLAGRRLHRAVQLGREGGHDAVYFTSADVHLDLGGIAKGYGVDRAVDALRRHGVRDALVNVGGDLYALGLDADGSPWRIGIRDPRDATALVDTVEASDCAIATSGDYEQFFRHRGLVYHHLMDPATGAPRAAAVHGVSVQAARGIDADAAATAAFNLAGERASTVLASRGARLLHAG